MRLALIALLPALVCFGCPAIDAAGDAIDPLIPRELLLGAAQESTHRLSPPGDLLAHLAPAENGVMNIWVREIPGGTPRLVTGGQSRDIWDYAWAPDGRSLLYFGDTAGEEDYHLFRIELDGGNVRDLTPFLGVRARNLLIDPNHPDEILVGLNLRDRRYYDMYRLDLNTGGLVLDTENMGDVLSWAADRDFVIRGATVFEPSTLRTIIRVRDGDDRPWRDLVVYPFERAPMLGQLNGASMICGFGPSGDTIRLTSSLHSDTTELVEVDLRTGERLAALASHPHADMMMTSEGGTPRSAVSMHPRTGAIQAVIFEYDRPEYVILDAAVGKDLDHLGTVHQGFPLIVSRDLEDRWWVVTFLRDDGPADHYLFDRDSRNATHLASSQPGLEQFRMAPREPRIIRSRDGLDLVSYLSLPPGAPPGPGPMVLLVHGGPWWRDAWGFDPVAQLLANRGYAVLQVNFRGSIGFGLEFLNASNGEMGGKMHDDLIDGVNWAIAEGIADPERVAIMGGSYGGYAALAGLTFTPEVFACGVSLVGPADIRTTIESFPPWYLPVKARWLRRLGNVLEDDELNRRISPLHHVERIRAPLLIAHGANDARVKRSESDQMVTAIRAAGIPVTYLLYPDEGHGFSSPASEIDFTGRVEEFLAEHLGGRGEPWREMPGVRVEAR